MTFWARANVTISKTWPLLLLNFILGAMSADQLGFHANAAPLTGAILGVLFSFVVFMTFGFE